MAADVSETARSLGKVASELARRWARQQAAAVQGYGRILADYGAGRDNGRATAEALAKLAASEAARYPADVLNLWSDYLSAIAGRAATPSAASANRIPTVLDIDLAGPPGGVATRDFVLDNPHDTAAAIGLVAGGFSLGDADLGVRPVFDPANFTLAPQQERKVSVQVAIDASVFRSGHVYTAHAAVSGFDHLILRLHLSVIGPH